MCCNFALDCHGRSPVWCVVRVDVAELQVCQDRVPSSRSYIVVRITFFCCVCIAQEPSLFMLERKADDPRVLYYFFQEMRQGRSRSKAYSATPAGRKVCPTRLSSAAGGLASAASCRVRCSHHIPAPTLSLHRRGGWSRCHGGSIPAAHPSSICNTSRRRKHAEPCGTMRHEYMCGEAWRLRVFCNARRDGHVTDLK